MAIAIKIPATHLMLNSSWWAGGGPAISVASIHAQEHGGVAGRNAAGGNESYAAVPSFWSEQYDLYIQGVGWPDQAAKRVRRSLAGKATLLLETKAGKITYALGINAQRDLAAIRRLIERNIPVDADALADPAKPFNAMLRRRRAGRDPCLPDAVALNMASA